MLDVCDFPQIAAAMGVDASVQQHLAVNEMSRSSSSAPTRGAMVSQSPYGLSATGPNGHMRNLEDVESDVIRMAISRYEGHMHEVARRQIGRAEGWEKGGE